MYAGHSFQKMSAERFGRETRPGRSDSITLRHLDSIKAMESIGDQTQELGVGPVSVYLDMDANANWQYRTQPGALRRIISKWSFSVLIFLCSRSGILLIMYMIHKSRVSLYRVLKIYPRIWHSNQSFAVNLFGNSLKFTKRGFIHVNFRLEPTSSQALNLHLTVTDSGIGIGDDFLRHKLFTPFSQENQLSQGTGLGLSVVYKIVRMLGGRISVESQVNVGTSVKVSLPMYAPNGATKGNEELAKHISALSGLRIDISGLNADFENVDDVRPRLPLGNISNRESVENMCRQWLQMQVIEPGKSDTKADVMICNDIRFDELSAKVDRGDILPPTIVICGNAVGAHEYASALKPTSQIPVAEFVSLP